jgi:hypothetical protein
MRRLKVNLLAFVGCAALLACRQAHAQPPSPEPAHEEPARVIHPDLQTADKVEEPAPAPQRFWASADWWVGWIKNANFPVLVTVGATSQPLPGAIGADGTETRFGGGNVEAQMRQGARFHLGGWFDDEECVGMELGYAFLASRAVVFALASPGSPVIARPFFDVNAQREDASLVSYPGVAAGSVSVHSGTSLQAADANLFTTLNGSKDYPLRLLAGFRFLQLHDDLDVQEDVQVDPSSAVLAGQHIGVHDHFACDNYFYGGNLGLSAVYHVRRLELQITAQCALGVNHEVVNIAGGTRFDGPGGSQLVPGGLLALSSNSGVQGRDVFAVVPELDLDARFEVTRHLIVSAGYSFLYWSRAARTGQQVDLHVNPDLVPTSTTFGPSALQQPQPGIRDTDFWVHGVHFGVELRF